VNAIRWDSSADAGVGSVVIVVVQWKRAEKTVGLEQFALHDVRSAGLTLAAQSGATIPALRARAGHSTSVAALAYQRTAVEQGSMIAGNMHVALRAVAS
jgi:hypothetical protein